MDPIKTTSAQGTGAALGPDPVAAPAAPTAPAASTAPTMAIPTPAAEPAAASNPLSPLDFTSTTHTGLSVSDSLDSAKDNLTSAGMAAKDLNNGAMGLDQIGDASAMMERPEEPLIPAAPVPGSLGSVTSGPTVGVETVQPAAAPATPESPAAPAPADAPEASTTPYNPFAQNAEAQPTPAQPAPAQTSSTSVPTGLQPKLPKFSMPKVSNKLALILGIVAGVFAVAMVIFIVLWVQALNNPKVVYVPTVSETTEPVETGAVCSLETAGDVEGLEGLTGMRSVVNMKFLDDRLANSQTTINYYFTDAEQAEANRANFEAMVAMLALVVNENGETPLTGTVEIVDNTVNLTTTLDVETALTITGLTLDLPANEFGEYQLTRSDLVNYMTTNGYNCQ